MHGYMLKHSYTCTCTNICSYIGTYTYVEIFSCIYTNWRMRTYWDILLFAEADLVGAY